MLVMMRSKKTYQSMGFDKISLLGKVSFSPKTSLSNNEQKKVTFLLINNHRSVSPAVMVLDLKSQQKLHQRELN